MKLRGESARAKLKLNWRERGEQNSSLSSPPRFHDSAVDYTAVLPFDFPHFIPPPSLLSSLFPTVSSVSHPYHYSGGIRWIIHNARKTFTWIYIYYIYYILYYIMQDICNRNSININYISESNLSWGIFYIYFIFYIHRSNFLSVCCTHFCECKVTQNERQAEIAE